MKKTRLISLVIVAVMLAAMLAACGGNGDVVNTAPPTNRPVIIPPTPVPGEPTPAPLGALVDGVWQYYDTVTITALYAYNAARIREEDVSKTWLLEYARNEMNINIETILYTTEQAGSVLPLLMAAGDYPEAFLFFMYGLNGTGNHTRWGDQEQILIPLNNWLFNRDVMPNVSRILLDEFPADVPSLATATGNIYQIPTILQHMEYAINMSNQYLWYDTRVLSAVGMDVPQTVYQFRDFLLAVKDQDPKGLGPNNNIPLGGRHGSFLPWAPFMNAFGFVSGGPTAMVSLVNGRFIDGPGELVPLQTHPNYFAFLQYMHSLHADGLFDLDFFTQEAAQATAKANQDFYTVWPAFNPNEFHADSYRYYHAMAPLTSTVNNVQHVNTGASQLGGNYQIFLTHKASDLQQEAMMRFADRAYDIDFRWAAFNGPQTGVHDDYGLNLTGWHWENGVVVHPDLSNGRFDVRGDLLWASTPFSDGGNAFDRRTDGSELNNLNLQTVTGHWHNQVLQNQIPYLVRSIPGYTPREADATFMNDMWSVLTDLMTTALAQFVTGARPITEAEFAAYGRELAAAGYDEYCRIFIETLNDTYGK